MPKLSSSSGRRSLRSIASVDVSSSATAATVGAGERQGIDASDHLLRAVRSERPAAAMLRDSALEHEMDARHRRVRAGEERLAAAERAHVRVLGDDRELVGMHVGEKRQRLDRQEALDAARAVFSLRHENSPSS